MSKKIESNLKNQTNPLASEAPLHSYRKKPLYSIRNEVLGLDTQEGEKGAGGAGWIRRREVWRKKNSSHAKSTVCLPKTNRGGCELISLPRGRNIPSHSKEVEISRIDKGKGKGACYLFCKDVLPKASVYPRS